MLFKISVSGYSQNILQKVREFQPWFSHKACSDRQVAILPVRRGTGTVVVVVPVLLSESFIGFPNRAFCNKTISVLCSPIFLGYSAMDSFEMHMNFTNGKVNQLRTGAVPVYRQGTHLDPPRGLQRYTCLTCASFAKYAIMCYFLLVFNWMKWFPFFVLMNFLCFWSQRGSFFMEEWIHRCLHVQISPQWHWGLRKRSTHKN